MLKYLYFILLISLQQCCAYHIDPSLTFSEVIESTTTGKYLEHLTVTHPLYDEVAASTLPIETYKTLIQQDHLYVQNFFHIFRILAERENDLRRKSILLKYGSENWDEYFQQFYTKFNFTPAVHMIPSTLEYAASEIIAAKYEDIGVALASAYPCYTIWRKMGIRFSKLVDFSNDTHHPYKEFIEANIPSEHSTQQFLEYTDFLNEYYDDLENSTELQQKMVEAYLRSAELEFAFANGIYQQKPEMIHPAQFSDLVEMISPKLQNDVIYHELYQELSDGIVPLEKFKIFLQQRDLYLRGFYKAFEYLAKRESDPNRKAELTKYQKLISSHLYGPFNDEPVFTEYYTNAYMEHVLAAALQEPVAVGLASLYPYYSLWNKIGNWLSNSMHPTASTDHPYKMFIEANDPRNNTQMETMNELINGYYNRSANDIEIQLKMVQAVRKSINYELLMANGVYEFGRLKFGGK